MLTRISEIIHALIPIHEGAAFFDFSVSIEANPIKKKFFQDIEAHLKDIDEGQWQVLLPVVVDRFKFKDKYRGWQQAFDAVREGVAYSLLKKNGFNDIKFLPRLKNQKTPDLEARKDSANFTIEVKCINPSQDEVRARQDGTPRDTGQPLGLKFFDKLQNTLLTAAEQLATRRSDKKLIFLFLNLDDSLGEYVSENLAQIGSWLEAHAMVADQYYVYSHPAYYFASSQSEQPHFSVWPSNGERLVVRGQGW